MTNGKMLEELRKLASEEKIDSDVALRLSLSATAEIYSVLTNMSAVRDEDWQKLEKHRKEYVAERGEQTKLFEKIHTEIKLLSEKVVKITENPSIRVGAVIKDYPKIAWFVAVLLILVSNLWFISGFRQAVLLFLKIPPEIINFLAPIN